MPFLRGSFRTNKLFWWFTFTPCLPVFVRVITVTVVVSTSFSAPRPTCAATTCAGTVTTCAGTVTTACSTAATASCGLLAWLAPAGASCTASGFLSHLHAVCQLQTLAFRGIFVPVDFGHWDLLSVLLLEVGDEFSHLVGTPTSLCESFLQSSRKPVVNEESREGFSRGHMGWAGWQSQVYLLLYPSWCPCPLRWLGVFIRRVLQHHLPVRTSPWSRVLLRVLLSSSHC